MSDESGRKLVVHAEMSEDIGLIYSMFHTDDRWWVGVVNTKGSDTHVFALILIGHENPVILTVDGDKLGLSSVDAEAGLLAQSMIESLGLAD